MAALDNAVYNELDLEEQKKRRPYYSPGYDVGEYDMDPESRETYNGAPIYTGTMTGPDKGEDREPREDRQEPPPAGAPTTPVEAMKLTGTWNGRDVDPNSAHDLFQLWAQGYGGAPSDSAGAEAAWKSLGEFATKYGFKFNPIQHEKMDKGTFVTPDGRTVTADLISNMGGPAGQQGWWFGDNGIETGRGGGGGGQVMTSGGGVYGGSGGGGAYGGGGGGGTGLGDLIAKMIADEEARKAGDEAFRTNIRNTITGRLEEAGKPVDPNDPILAGQRRAYSSEQDRAVAQAREAMAARAAHSGIGTGALDATIQSSIEAAGDAKGQHASMLEGERWQAKLDELRDLLHLGAGIMSNDEQRQLQTLIAGIEGRLGESEIATRSQLGNRELDIRSMLGMEGIGLERERLGQGDRHFYDNLGYMAGRDQSLLDRELMNLLLGG